MCLSHGLDAASWYLTFTTLTVGHSDTKGKCWYIGVFNTACIGLKLEVVGPACLFYIYMYHLFVSKSWYIILTFIW